MINEDSFNTLINQVVYSLDHLLKNKDYSQEVLNYLYLITTGMILTYGDSFVEEIYDTILDTKIIKKPSLVTSLDYYDNPINNNYLYKNVTKKVNTNYLTYEYGILFTEIDNSFIKTLEYLVYSYNKLLFHRKDKVSLKDNLLIQIDKFFHNGYSSLIKKDSLKAIDKVILLLQGEDVIKRILKLKKVNIKNGKFKKALDSLKKIKESEYTIEGLESLVTLFRPIYNAKGMKEIINTHKGVSLLEKEFNRILGRNAYLTLCNSIEFLDKKLSNLENEQDNKYYDFATRYLILRNEFINKFLKLRYT